MARAYLTHGLNLKTDLKGPFKRDPTELIKLMILKLTKAKAHETTKQQETTEAQARPGARAYLVVTPGV